MSHIAQAVRPVVQLPQYIPPPASGDLRYGPFLVTAFIHLVTLTSWPWNWCLTSSMAQTTVLLLLVFLLLQLSIVELWANMCQTDDVCYNLDLWGHRTRWWYGASYSMRTPSLKFVGLPVGKTWLIFGHYVKHPGDLDLWPCDLKTGHILRSPVSWGSFLPNFSLLLFSTLDQAWETQTIGQKDDGQQCFMPHPMGERHKNLAPTIPIPISCPRQTCEESSLIHNDL